jgi:hypothetical protein
VRSLQPVSEGGVLWTSEPGTSRSYGELKIPPAPGLKVCRLCHGERCREARKKVTVVLAIGHALRAHEALSRPDALPGLLEVLHSLFEDGVFVGHDRSIRTSDILRSPDYFAFSRKFPYQRREVAGRVPGYVLRVLWAHLQRPNPLPGNR